MRYVFLYVMLLTVTILSAGCVPGGGSGSSSSGEALQPLSLGGYTVLSANIDSSDLGLLNGSSPLRVKSDGTTEAISFTVQNTSTGQVSTMSLGITALKYLADGYLVLGLTGNITVLVQISTGAVYNLNGDNIAEMQMLGTSLYALNDGTGILSQIGLSPSPPVSTNVNNPSETASNSASPVIIYSSLNSSSSPFRFLAYNQYAENTSWLSPSFIFLGDGNIAANGGPSGNPRVMIFNANAAAYDCDLANPYDNVGGGATGGVIQAANQNLYQAQIINSPNCSLPGVTCGDQLVKYDTSTRAGMCGASSVVVSLDSISHFPTDINAWITYKAHYHLQDVNRYIVAPSGFLETADDGNGGVTMSWTTLNLSGVPTGGSASNQNVVLDGTTLYWLSGSSIFYQALAAGTTPSTYYSSAPAITSFDVIHGHVFFTTAQGSFVVSSPGGSAVSVPSQIDLTGTVKF